MSTLILIIGHLVIAIIIVRPLWGALLMWPVLLCYPHAATEEVLPLNIGFDDLYVSVLFVIVLIRRQLDEQRVRFGRWGALVLSFWLISLISNLVGMLLLPQVAGPVPILKDTLKQITFPFVALIVLNAVTTPEQIRQLVRWLLIGCIGLSVVAILQWFMPYQVAAFYHSQQFAPGERVIRATGTTRGPWELGGVLALAVIMSVSLLTIGGGIVRRLVPLLCAGFGFFALILTTSRASWLFLLCGVLVVLVVGKRPIRGLIVVGLVASLLIVFPMLLETVQYRVEYTGSLQSLDHSSRTRLDIWRHILGQLDFGSILLGVGSLGAFSKYQYTPHNYYIAIITQYGLAGVVYFVVLGTALVRRILMNMRREQNRDNAAIWKGILATTLGFLAYSLTADSLNTDLIAKAMFFCWSFLYLRDYVALGEETPSSPARVPGYTWPDRPLLQVQPY